MREAINSEFINSGIKKYLQLQTIHTDKQLYIKLLLSGSMTLQPIQIQTHFTYKLANADMDYLKFYVAKALGNEKQLTVKFTQSWRNSYKEDDLRRMFFNVMEKFNDKIQSLQGEITKYQQVQKQLKNYQQFKDYYFIIQRFNIIENARIDPRSSLKNQDPFDKKCAEIVQKMKLLEEKYTPVVEYQKLKHTYQKVSKDLEVYRKSLSYIHEPLRLKTFLNQKENIISLKDQQIEKLNKITQVASQLERFKKVFEYYETNLSQISQQLKNNVICLDGVRKMIQIKQQSGNKWEKQNKYLKGAHVCLHNLLENTQKSKQQITGHLIDKQKFQKSISSGLKQILKAILYLLESNFSETSIGNSIEVISKYSYKNKEIEVLVNKIIEIGTIESKNHSFQLEVGAIWIKNLNTLQKPISTIKELEKNLSIFSWSLDNSKYHEKEQVKQMKKILQTSFARKLLIHLGNQKKFNLKQSCLPKIIKSYSSQFTSEFSECLKYINERKDKETKYLQAIRQKLGHIYYSLYNNRYLNPRMDTNDIYFYSQMKRIVDQLAQQAEKIEAKRNKFVRTNSPTRVGTVNNSLEQIDALHQVNKFLEHQVINSKSQLEQLKLVHNNCEQYKKQRQESNINLHQKVALLQASKQKQHNLLRVKYENQKLTQQSKLKQQFSEQIQKLQVQYKIKIKLLNQQLTKQKKANQQQIRQLLSLKQNLQFELENLKKDLQQNKLNKQRQQIENSLKQQIHPLSQTIKQYDMDKTKLLKQLEEIKNERQKLKNEIEKLKDDLSNTNKQKKSLLNDQKLRLTDQKGQLNNTIQQLKEQKGKINLENKQLHEKISSLVNQNQKQKQKLIAQNNQLAFNNTLFSKNNEQLLNKNVNLQIELKNLQQKSNSQLTELKQSIQQRLIEQKAQLQQQFQQKIQQFKKQQQQPSIDPQQQRNFSQVTDIDTLRKQIKEKTKTNRNLLNSYYQLQEKIEQLKGQKTKLSKDLLETKKSIDEIKKSNQQQIKKLTIQRNRALQAVQKQKKVAEFKAIVEKNNTSVISISQNEKLELIKIKSDLQNEKKLHKNNLQAKCKEILMLNQRIDKLIAEKQKIEKINSQQKQKIASIFKFLNGEV